jgi:biopolymer transport protein ExbB/TolQ
MDNMDASDSQSSCSPTPGQIVVFTSAAALAAAVIGLIAYVLLQNRASSPRALLDRCQSAIDRIERGLGESDA